MGSYGFWIDWFRGAAAKLPGARGGGAPGGAGYDEARLRRVLKGGAGRAPARDIDRIRSLSPAQRMIDWLGTQPPVIVDAAAANLNWDQAGEVILWLVQRPATDAATAVKLFLRAEPAFYVDAKAENPACDYDEAAEAVILSFASNWTAQRYARGGVGYDPTEVSPYGSSDVFFINELNADIAACRAKGAQPIPPLHGLAGPFHGPKPKELDAYLRAYGRDESLYVRFLYAGLGTWFLDDEIDDAEFDAWIRRNNLADE